ncbi:MAG: bifunctional oligoribonuclease/PAP phosphatase NrnA [Bdellovibrio sp.]|nr:bifunctional oligoribonuclease/PAP phosphatase NrnA [Bdellovibrio sp.]
MNIKERFKQAISLAKNIVVTTHIYPDADGIGAQIALCLALHKLGKWVIGVNQKSLLQRYHYLDTSNLVISAKEFQKNHSKKEIDLLIVTDTNYIARIGPETEKAVARARDVLFIDHHPCPKEIAAIHCIDTNKAATSELVGEFIDLMGVEFTPEIALPLYTGILVDTSSFRYPTVTGNTHLMVAKLMNAGVAPSDAYNMIYGTKKTDHIRLLGKILAQTKTNKSGSMAWITVYEKDLKEHKVDAEDTHAFINHLLVLDNIQLACMFRELPQNQVKISLRSTVETVDAGAMAQALGGGGHDHSAAAILEGSLDDLLPATLEKLERMLSEK